MSNHIFKGLKLGSFAFIVQAQTNNSLVTQSSSQTGFDTFLVLFLLALIFFILYDLRQNFKLLRAAWDKISQKYRLLIAKLKRIRNKQQNNQKLGTQEQISTDKGTMGFMEGQKSYIQSDIISIQEAANTSSSQPDQLKQMMSLPEQSPKVNLKQVFGRKQKREGNRSRSKIKNRIQIKKSQLQSEEIETPQIQYQDLEKSLDNEEK